MARAGPQRDRRMSATHTTTRSGDGTVILAPRDESAQSATVIICHGLGDTSDGFVDVAERLSAALPYAKFVLPTAPTRRVTMNGGVEMRSWYDIVGLDKRSNEVCEGIEESRARLASLVEHETSALGLPRRRVVLAGFSQGGALSLYTGMMLPPGGSMGGGGRLGGIVVMSGYLPHSSGFVVSPGLESTPVFHGHGESDPLVRPDTARESRDVVTGGGGTDYRLVMYPNLGHSVSPGEVADVLAFLREVIPPDDSCRVRLKDPADMSVKELKAAIARAGLGRMAVGFSEKREFVDLLRRHREGKVRELRRAE
jgi:predicted esterase